MKYSDSSKTTGSGAAAFTLIELLVVISIIAILATFAMSAGKGVLENAKKASARNDMGQIVIAIKSYYTDYGRNPTPNSMPNQDITYSSIGGKTQNSMLMNALRCPSDNLDEVKDMNPRQTRYLEVTQAKSSTKPVSGIDTKGNWMDPWGDQYAVFVDGDYDNKISVSALFTSGLGSSTDPTSVGISVGAASVGLATKVKIKTVPAKYDQAIHLVSWR